MHANDRTRMDTEQHLLHRLCIPLSPDDVALRRDRAAAPRRRRQVPTAALALALCSPGLGGAQGGTPAAGTAALAQLDCLIQPSQTVQVGTASAGVIQSVKAERGDYVRRGQALVHLESQVERAALAMAREKAQQAGEMLATRGASELAQRELERAADLVKENFVSRTFYDRQRAEVEVAHGRGRQAEERRRLAEREVELAAAQLSQRTVSSPVDGVVVERHVGPGEYVEQKPVMRIAQIDPLRVDVLVPASAFGQVALGSKVPVTPELLNRQARMAVITGVDRVIDAASHTFRVRLELPNPGGKLPPGLRCKADLVAALSDGVAAPPPPARHENKVGAGTPAPLPREAVPTPQPAAIEAPKLAARETFMRFERRHVAMETVAVASVPVKLATQTAYAPADEPSSDTALAPSIPLRLRLSWPAETVTTRLAADPATGTRSAQAAAKGVGTAATNIAYR
jgi:RND family efflux transporter MFP subunit